MFIDLAESALFLGGTVLSLSRALLFDEGASPSRRAVRDPLRLIEDVLAVVPAGFLMLAVDVVVLLGVTLRLSRFATISSRKSSTACGSSALSPGAAAVPDVDDADGLRPAEVPDDVAGFAAGDDVPSLLGVLEPSNESRLSKKDSTSSRCERTPAVLAEGVPGRDIVT